MAEKDTIRLKEGEVVTYTITVKRAGAVVDLGNYTPTFYAHDDEAAKGINKIDGAAMTVVGDGSTGQATMAFTSTHTSLSGGDSLKGSWRVLLSADVGDDEEWCDKEDFQVDKNEMVA